MRIPRPVCRNRNLVIRIAIDLRDRISKDYTTNTMTSVGQHSVDRRMLAETSAASVRPTYKSDKSDDKSATRVDIALLVSMLFLQRFSLPFGATALHLDFV